MAVFAILERLSSSTGGEMDLVSKQEAESLSSKLTKIQVGLQEAERMGVSDKGVKSWLKELEDVTYEMDDVLDEFAAANLQVEVQGTSLNWDKVRSLLDSLCLCFNQVVSRREITQKMKALSERIDYILSEKDKFILVPSKDDHGHEFKQEESTSLVDVEFKTYGQENDKKSLVLKLISEGENSHENTQIISIVGVGGVGKTTLAREAYNDPDVEGLFDLKGWVSVPQSLDAFIIGRAILESFGEKLDGYHDMETLAQHIKNAVNNKRFLLVLDDVWTENRNMWEILRNCLDGGKGSRIVVTTRLESVAIMMDTTQWQFLGLLSDLDCGKILNGVALEGRVGGQYEKLRDIGMEIGKKCNGLPLAATSLGGMLKVGLFTIREWRNMLESPLWNEVDEVSDIFRILNLSYIDLSPLLKCCFLSSVIFPKGTSISIDEIIRIWMAYGYLNSSCSADEVQLKGFQYFNNLAMRSFFHRVAIDDMYDDGGKLYKMHDIMHDFASYLSVSDGYSFIMDGESRRSSSSHINLPWNSLGRLRTFSVCREELHPDIVSHLTSVRVLSVIACSLKGLPEDIGKLIHLRYLNVSDNPIRVLPETITDLCNLQTLNIESCCDLSSIPEGMEKLINLRHLLNSGTYSLVEFPQGLEELSGLWTLSEFRGCQLGLLRNLNELQGEISLFLQDFDVAKFGDPMLWEKQHIEGLKLYFGEEEEMDEVVEALKPPPNLLTLQVSSVSGKWLSHWITSFDKLKVILFDDFGEWPDMPPFCKLPALEELVIGFPEITRLRIGFLGLDGASSSSSSSSRQVVGGFPRLKKLRFIGCIQWQEWEDIEQESVPVLTSLEELELSHCRRLKDLPLTLLGKATSLRVVTVSNSEYLSQRYNKISGDDRDKIPLLPNQMWNV